MRGGWDGMGYVCLLHSTAIKVWEHCNFPPYLAYQQQKKKPPPEEWVHCFPYAYYDRSVLKAVIRRRVLKSTLTLTLKVMTPPRKINRKRLWRLIRVQRQRLMMISWDRYRDNRRGVLPRPWSTPFRMVYQLSVLVWGNHRGRYLERILRMPLVLVLLLMAIVLCSGVLSLPQKHNHWPHVVIMMMMPRLLLLEMSTDQKKMSWDQ